MAVYVNDAIWRRLSEYYNVTPRQAQVGDLYKRWLDEKNLNWGNAADYFISQFPGVVNRGDAEWLFWTGGFGDDLVLLLDAAQERQTGTAPQWVLNRADTRVPSARVGSVGSAELRGVYHGLLLPGTVGNYASVPAAGVGNPGNSLDVRARVQMFATTGGSADIVCKGFGVASQAGWVLRQSGSTMTCFVSTDGTNFSRTLSASHGLQIGDSAWFRFTYDGVTGRMVLFQAGDSDVEPDVWVTVASGVFTVGAVHASTQDVRVGVSGGNTNPFHGAVKRVVVRHTLGDGLPVLDTDFTAATPFAGSFTAGTSQTVTVTAASGVDSNDPTFLQHTGTNYLYSPGVAGNYASTPDSAALDITGDIEIVARVALDDWTPTGGAVLVAKSTVSFSYDIRIESNGRMRLPWSTDGTAINIPTSTVSVAFTDGQAGWIKVTRTLVDGVVRFYTAPDSPVEPTGAGWTQLGTDVVSLAGTPIFAGASQLEIGSRTNGTVGLAAVKFYQAIIRNGIGGTVAFDADFTTGITNGNQTTFTESSTNAATVTINRSTSGKKSVAVVRPVWLFGTNSFMQVVDSALLDFGANDSFTVIALTRQWATPTGRILYKGGGGSVPGWDLVTVGSTHAFYSSDAVNGDNASSPTFANGALNLSAAVFDRTNNKLTVYSNGVAGTPDTSLASGSLANSNVLNIGQYTSGFFGEFELLAVAVVRRALTATELEYVQEKFTVTPVVPGKPAVTVTGATTTTDGLYTIQSWTTSGSIAVAGGTLDVEYLVVAGGGGGGRSTGGGGGAGGLLTNLGTPTAISGVQTVTVGAGGIGGQGATIETSGSSSSFGLISASGGGRGGTNSTTGANGGSGGGGGTASVGSTAGGTGIAGQGNGGGSGRAGGNFNTGGGGGAGAVGVTPATNTSPGGNGGAGVASTITGSSVDYAGGGGGGSFSGTGGTGGIGGGGNGTVSGVATSGVDGSGGGGGGSGDNSSAKPSGAGGDGIVIVRYLTASVA